MGQHSYNRITLPYYFQVEPVVTADVMQQAADIPERLRKNALTATSIALFGFTLYRTNLMLKPMVLIRLKGHRCLNRE
ncbi:hypothetical protein KWF26_09140 [Acinetobacter baumannii]|uniref:hypothetical protein n=1 Tax=Acinetobacter baumannii TaxID=470 RepID=UPI0011445D49|nr:hypothetical protein [Acinetobacter baumannii]